MNAIIKRIKDAVISGEIAPILVVGDLMLDEYHWCNVKRISPEAPVPVCKVNNTTLSLGGAGNVANNIQNLSVNTTIFGFVGEDSSGDKLVKLFKKNQINNDGVIKTERPTILKSRVIAHQQQVVRLDREDDHPLSLKERNQLFKVFEKHIKNCSAVVISDYLKGTLTESFISKIITTAKAHQKIVIVDPKGESFLKYKNATVITPNFSEFQAVVGQKIKTEKEIFDKGKQLLKKLNIDALLLTRSEKGMSIIRHDSKIDISSDAKEVFDITGAGDTVVAVLTLALANGLDVEQAAKIANKAAGLVVEKQGTATVSWSEMENLADV